VPRKPGARGGGDRGGRLRRLLASGATAPMRCNLVVGARTRVSPHMCRRWRLHRRRQSLGPWAERDWCKSAAWRWLAW